MNLRVDERAATTVMLVSEGYPGKYEKGKTITGLADIKDSIVFHAGTKANGKQTETNGGRVLAVTSFGDTISDALETSYANAERIRFNGKYYRKDIGFDLKNKLQPA